jgi:pilus assembly protein Flp/PilA
MIIKIDMYLRNLLERFAKQEDGMIVTEYLALVGLFLGGAFTAVVFFTSVMGTLWTGWGLWITTYLIA